MCVCQRTNHEISIRTLNAFAPCQIEKFSRQLKIAGEQGKIRKCGEVFFELGELSF